MSSLVEEDGYEVGAYRLQDNPLPKIRLGGVHQRRHGVKEVAGMLIFVCFLRVFLFWFVVAKSKRPLVAQHGSFDIHMSLTFECIPMQGRAAPLNEFTGAPAVGFHALCHFTLLLV